MLANPNAFFICDGFSKDFKERRFNECRYGVDNVTKYDELEFILGRFLA